MNELISRQKLIEDIEREFDGVCTYDVSPSQAVSDFIEIVDRQPPADSGTDICVGTNQWIPVTYRETTEEEREYGIEWKYILDCPLPDNDTEILVCTKAGSVWTDTFFNDDGCYLDGGYDFTELVAWMPLPEPYKGE